MKTLLPLLFLLSFFQSSFSQKFVRNDAQWVYNFHGAHGVGYTLISYEQDTVIGNKTVKQFGRFHTQAFSVTDTINIRTGAIFLFESNGIVEYSIEGMDFDTLYNFNAALGEVFDVDSLFTERDTGLYHYSTIFSTVTDTFSYQINGESLFAKEIEYEQQYFDGRQDGISHDTLVQYLGLMRRYIDPADLSRRVVDGGEGGYLRCYKNNDLGTTESPGRGNVGSFVYDCEDLVATTSIKNAIANLYISSFPNPAKENLKVKNTTNLSLSVDLIDAQGRQLKQLNIHPGENEISISHLPAGIYFLMVERGGFQKFWKE
ncbi:MAG: T9SS type A sorting domain-containing protein [Bacteroidia bacterium]|nr:T9SS type A sorting domain-containing protein [Bacteroidia bacterium]